MSSSLFDEKRFELYQGCHVILMIDLFCHDFMFFIVRYTKSSYFTPYLHQVIVLELFA